MCHNPEAAGCCQGQDEDLGVVVDMDRIFWVLFKGEREGMDMIGVEAAIWAVLP